MIRHSATIDRVERTEEFTIERAAVTGGSIERRPFPASARWAEEAVVTERCHR